MVSELRLLLEDDDPTWDRIGLHRPAERYRIYKKEDPEGAFVPIAATTDPFAKIDGLARRTSRRSTVASPSCTTLSGQREPGLAVPICLRYRTRIHRRDEPCVRHTNHSY